MKKHSLKWIALHFPELLASVSITISILLTGFTAVTRYAFSYTYGGADEINVICFAWTTFMGAAAAYRCGMHYGIDLAVMALPPTVRKIAGLIAQIFILVIVAVLAALSFKLTVLVGTKVYTYTKISYVVSDAAILLSFLLMTIYSVISLFKKIKSFSSDELTKGGAEVC